MFIYLDPDVLAPCFGGSDERGAAAGKGVEDQGARGGGRLYELLQQLDGLLVGVCEALVADLGTGDQVVRPFPGQLESAKKRWPPTSATKIWLSCQSLVTRAGL